MPNPGKLYVCPRCLYEVNLKWRMRRHLYEIKTECRNVSGVELTDDIREHVLRHQTYVPPIKNKTTYQIFNQTVNNYNTLNNFIAQMDFQEKIDRLLEYQQKNLIGLEDSIEKRFEYRVNRLEDDKFQAGYFLTQNNLIELIDDVTRIDKDNLHKFNVFYNKAIKRFKMYQGKDWESFIEEVGAKELVSLIKSYFLDSYELYLIKHLHGNNVKQFNRFKLEEHLGIYYHFIGVFDLAPSICDQNDSDLLGHRLTEESDHFLADKYMDLFFSEKKKLKSSEEVAITRKIVNIIKNNTSQNLSELNNVLMDLLKIDQEFRDVILESKQIKESS
jgi:hypothetical protein